MSDDEYMSDLDEYSDDDNVMMDEDEQGMSPPPLQFYPFLCLYDLGTSNSDGGGMDEDDDYMDDIRVEASKDKLKVYETEHSSLSVKDIEKLVRKDADDIVEFFGIDVSLIYYRFHLVVLHTKI